MYGESGSTSFFFFSTVGIAVLKGFFFLINVRFARVDHRPLDLHRMWGLFIGSAVDSERRGRGGEVLWGLLSLSSELKKWGYPGRRPARTLGDAYGRRQWETRPAPSSSPRGIVTVSTFDTVRLCT